MRGEKTTFTTHPPCREYHCGGGGGLTPCVGATRIPSGSQEVEAAAGGEGKDREAEWGCWGVLSGLQSVTMVTPHH